MRDIFDWFKAILEDLFGMDEDDNKKKSLAPGKSQRSQILYI